MKPQSLEVLSAFMDGEMISPESLSEALMAPGGREALVAFARLRAEMAGDDSRPSDAFYRAMSGEVGGRRPLPRWAPRALRIAASAALLALAARGATDLLRRPADQPPPAARVLRFTPGVDWHEGPRQGKE